MTRMMVPMLRLAMIVLQDTTKTQKARRRVCLVCQESLAM